MTEGKFQRIELPDLLTMESPPDEVLTSGIFRGYTDSSQAGCKTGEKMYCGFLQVPGSKEVVEARGCEQNHLLLHISSMLRASSDGELPIDVLATVINTIPLKLFIKAINLDGYRIEKGSYVFEQPKEEPSKEQ